MRTLFLRIFLWLWVAMAAVAAVLVVSSPLFTRSRPSLERWQHSSESYLQGRMQHAVEALGREGTAAFRSDGDHRGSERPQRLFVLDPGGGDVLGNEPPPEVVALARRAAESGQVEMQRESAVHYAAGPARDPQGRPLVVVLTLRRPPTLVDLLEPRVLAPRLLVLLLVAGALSFSLARHLTSPVAALRTAARRLADGDLTARVGAAVGRRRDELSELARDFDTMAERLVALLGAQQRLVRDVSHELRSPLARLRVALEIARNGPAEKTRRALDRIEEEADRLNEMVEQLLTLSRLEAVKAPAEHEPVDLAALLAGVVDDASFEAGARDCTVALEAVGVCTVTGSSQLLRSAVENVLRNAVHYTADGSQIEVGLAGEGAGAAARAVIRVRDHGPGIPEEHLGRVFQPFFRVDDARDRATGGAGLGLAIAARAIRLHGGTIVAANAPDGGLVVTISLPLAAAGDATA